MPPKHGKLLRSYLFSISYIVYYTKSKFVKKNSEIPDSALLSSVKERWQPLLGVMKSFYLCFIEYWLSFGKFHILYTNPHHF